MLKRIGIRMTQDFSKKSQLPVTVTLIVLNEEKNLGRALESVQWAKEILVVDAGSTDKTESIASRWGARFLKNPWAGYGQQKNFAHQSATQDWVLNIDADERVTDELYQEIRAVLQSPEPPVKGYAIPRKTFFLGRWIRHGGWYPNYLNRLSLRSHSRWSEPPVHESLLIEGEVRRLKEPLLHYSFHSIHDQAQTNLKFSLLGGQKLLHQGRQPSLLLLILKPIGKFLETYLWKRGFLDGWSGLIISVNASYSVFLKFAYLFESRIRTQSKEGDSQ